MSIIGLLLAVNAAGQFYNGHQMTFGKNRVQYFDYYWQYYRFDDFDCYFNEYGSDLAQYTASYATKKLEEIEDFFDYTLEKRLIFIIHNKMAEYKQSNIGLVTSEDENYNTGGMSTIIKNKAMLYYEGDHKAFDKQISGAIAEVLVNEILNNADVKDRVSSSSTITMPDWYFKGLTKYVAGEWDNDDENRVKDGILSGKFKKISHLENEDAVAAGESFWRFIGKQYGDALIPNIIYVTKIYKNVGDGFQYVTGVKLKELLKQWQEYYKNEYSSGSDAPGNDGNTLRKSRKDQIFQQVKVSPDGQYIAYVTNDLGRKRIWLYNQATGKQKIIFRREPKLEGETDKTYPVLAWHPGGRVLTFINEEKAGLVMYLYRVNDKTTEKRNMLYFEKVLDFSYSPEGTRLILSAVKDGMTDLYIHTISSATNEQITRDIADDLNPSFLKGSHGSIIFSSNRLSDSLRNDADPFQKRGLTYDLFIYDLSKKTNVLTRLSEGKYVNRLASTEVAPGRISYLGDASGIINRYDARFDSTISYVDTTTHYRYFIKSAPVSNYNRNIMSQSLAGNSDLYGEILYDRGRYELKKGKTSDFKPLQDKDLITTVLRKDQMRVLHRADSIEKIREWLIETDRKRRDTLKKPLYEYYSKNEPIDINHYIFEKEKQNYYNQLWRKDYMDIDLDTGHIQLPSMRIYETSFYNNYLVTQVDFTFLNNTYQVYNSGAPYYNPGVNGLTRFGIVDMFENYRLTGGFRLSGNLNSNEYLLSLENLKGKFDKQLIFYRQALLSSSDSVTLKNHTYNIYMSFAKPITPALALKGTIAYRNDREIFLPTDPASLVRPNISRHWASLKGEVIYDDTRKRTVNIYYGTRFKIFGEYYREITAAKSDMIVFGIDFRKYIKIHRELIWANRFAASASYGPNRLIYFLGGVDNWMGYIFNKYPMYDTSVPVNSNINYGFQALATNLRGFSQNIRNGDKFALINSELRWPVVRYLAGHPLKSNFLNSLQVVGFGDIGTAWSGKSPWSGENGYDQEVIKNGPVEVTLDSNREPIVAGFGAGARAQILGYFVRADWAWGIENNYLLPKMFYLSFSLDF
jgi:hypothetical protein